MPPSWRHASPPCSPPTLDKGAVSSQFGTQSNLLFMNILLITIPPLVMFLFVNRRIVAGMTAGAIKG